MHKENSRPKGENLPNLVTLIADMKSQLKHTSRACQLKRAKKFN
jgi:hypothetical protein